MAATTSLAGQETRESRGAASDAALFTLATYAAQVVQFAAGIIQKALLGPVAAGYWALLQNFWTFFSASSLGAHHGAVRQIPLSRGRGDLQAAERIAGTAGSFAFATYTVLGFLVATVALVFGGGWTDEMRFGLVLLGVTAPLRYASDICEVIIQAVKRFDVQAGTVLVQALAMLVFQTLAVAWVGFYGLFVGVVTISLGSFALWLKLGVVTPRQPAFHWTFDRGRLRELIRYGMPILVYGQVYLLFQAVDSLIVAGALTIEQLGFYALAVSVTNYVLVLPKSIGATLAPRMAERFSQTESASSVQAYAFDVQRVLAFVLLPVAIAGAYFLFPVLIRHALPAFTPAIEIVQIMVAATYFFALMSMPIKMLITVGYRWVLTGLILVALGLNAGLNLLAVGPLDLGLTGAAVATAVSYFLTWAMTGAYALSRTMNTGAVTKHLGVITLAFLYTYGGLRLVGALLSNTEGDLIDDLLLSSGQVLAFVTLLTPWIVYAERRLGAMTLLRDVVRQALGKLRTSSRR